MAEDQDGKVMWPPKRQLTQDEIDTVWRWNLEKKREEAERWKQFCHRCPLDSDWNLEEK